MQLRYRLDPPPTQDASHYSTRIIELMNFHVPLVLVGGWTQSMDLHTEIEHWFPRKSTEPNLETIMKISGSIFFEGGKYVYNLEAPTKLLFVMCWENKIFQCCVLMIFLLVIPWLERLQTQKTKNNTQKNSKTKNKPAHLKKNKQNATS